jgi:hypothetical protein
VSGQDKPPKPDYEGKSLLEISVLAASTAVAYSIINPLISLLYAWIWQTFFMPISN